VVTMNITVLWYVVWFSLV